MELKEDYWLGKYVTILMFQKSFPFSYIITQSCNLLVSFLFCGVPYFSLISKSIHLVKSYLMCLCCYVPPEEGGSEALERIN